MEKREEMGRVVGEELSRCYPLFPNLDRILDKKIVVCGVGGVGGFAVECLYRTGFRNMVVIDFDRFTPSNRNRQLGSEEIGRLKVEVFEERYPGVKGINLKLTPENVPTLSHLREADWIIDAIDHLPTKVALISCYWEKMVSSMGAGRRVDPTKVEVGTLFSSHTDPLARRLRKLVRERSPGIDVPVVFSTEPPKEGGSFVGVTATFGLVLGSFTIRELCKREGGS